MAVTITAVGSSLSGSGNKWLGGVLAPNGCVYGVPGNADDILKIDPSTDTVTRFGSVSAVTGTPAAGRNKYLDGVLVGSNIYCVPHDGNTSSLPVLIIHTATDSLSAFGAVPGIATYGRYAGGTRVGTRIWWTPDDPTGTGGLIRSVDTTVPQVDTHGTVAGSGTGWVRGKQVGSHIYAAPRSRATVLKIDTSTGTAIQFGSLGATSLKYSDTIYANGLLWMIPRSTKLRTVNPATDTISGSLGGPTGYLAADRWIDGKIYCVGTPSNVLEIDPATAAMTTHTASGLSWGFYGIVSTPYALYAIPSTATRVVKIAPPAPPARRRGFRHTGLVRGSRGVS